MVGTAFGNFPLDVRSYSLLRPPLRPGPEDVAIYRQLFDQWLASRGMADRRPRILLLGLTPELAVVPWCDDCHLLALDNSSAMIEAFWPGDTDRRRIVAGDWFAPPAEAAAVDVILGDGIFSLSRFPMDYRRLADILRRLLLPGGLFLYRAFCPEPAGESPERLLEELRRGRIGSFHIFKWRLAMALQGQDPREGIAVARIWRVFRDLFPTNEHCAALSGWDLETIGTIDCYRDGRAVLSFPQFEDLTAALEPNFRLTGHLCGRYELAERCPVLSLTPVEAP